MSTCDSELTPPVAVKDLNYLNLIVSRNFTNSHPMVKRIRLFDNYQDLHQNNREKLDIFNRNGILETPPMEGIDIVQFNQVKYQLDLPKDILKKLIFKPTPEELFLWAGDLFDELYERVLMADDKLKEIKAVLKVIQHSQYCQYIVESRICTQMIRFLKLIETFDACGNVCIDLVRVFCIKDSVKEALFQIPLPSLKFIVESSQKEKFHLFGLWEKRGHIIEKAIVPLLLENSETLIYLLQSGMIYLSSEKELELPIWHIWYANYYKRSHRRDNFRTIHRCFQVCNLSENPEITSSIALQYLWLSIPDPFLTLADFESIAYDMHYLQIDRPVNEIHEWYTKILKLPENMPKIPRSLQHVSRCAVRRSLAAKFQFPDVKVDLEVSESLLQYLFFSDLDDNK